MRLRTVVIIVVSARSEMRAFLICRPPRTIAAISFSGKYAGTASVVEFGKGRNTYFPGADSENMGEGVQDKILELTKRN